MQARLRAGLHFLYERSAGTYFVQGGRIFLLFVECETIILPESVKPDRIYDAPAVSAPSGAGDREAVVGGLIRQDFVVK